MNGERILSQARSVAHTQPGDLGAVAAGSTRTASVASDVLRAGGNAADAAVAGALTSLVSEALFTNAGSGALILIRESSGRVQALDAFAAMPGLDAPRKGHVLDFRAAMLRYGETDLSFYIGRGSVAVPGFLAGLAALHERFGSLPLARLVQPAVHAARDGVRWTRTHRELAGFLSPILVDTPENAALFGLTSGDGSPAPARLTQMPLLADMLEQIGASGLQRFYDGPVADAIVTDQAARGGLISHRDLKAYRVLETPTLRLRLAGWDLWLPGAPSLGGTMVAAMLALWALLAEDEPLPTHDSLSAPTSRGDRSGHDGLGVDATIAHRWAIVIDAVNSARETVERAAMKGASLERIVRPLLPDALDALRHPRPPHKGQDPHLPGGTTHLSVIDAAGMAVSMSSSAGESAGYLVPGLGTMMNNMLGEGDLHHGGFHSAAPGTRLPTMMAPMILTRGNAGYPRSILALGSGGSMRIRTALSQVTWGIAGEGRSLADAIELPRRHYEERQIHLEAARGANGERPEADRLRSIGYDVVAWPDLSSFFGGVHAARIDRPRSGAPMRANAHGDTRRDGGAMVVRGDGDESDT